VILWIRFRLRFYATRAQTNIAKQRNAPPTTARAIMYFVLVFRSEPESPDTGTVEGDSYKIIQDLGLLGRVRALTEFVGLPTT
jgi:hypothetical protein